MSEYTQPELPGVSPVELDGTGYDLVREINLCKDAIQKWADRQKTAHDQLLKLLTGEDETEATYTATWQGQNVAQVTVYTEKRFNAKAFQSDHPVLYDSYKTPALRKRLTTS